MVWVSFAGEDCLETVVDHLVDRLPLGVRVRAIPDGGGHHLGFDASCSRRRGSRSRRRMLTPRWIIRHALDGLVNLQFVSHTDEAEGIAEDLAR